MKKSQRIPRKWDWYTCAMFVLTGIALIPTPWNEASSNLIAIGVELFIGCMLQWQSYRSLPDEAQKRTDREVRDERNQMLRDRTGWLCWQAESLLFGPVAVIVIALTKHNEVVFLILGVLILRPLTEWAVYWWLGRKY